MAFSVRTVWPAIRTFPDQRIFKKIRWSKIIKKLSQVLFFGLHANFYKGHWTRGLYRSRHFALCDYISVHYKDGQSGNRIHLLLFSPVLLHFLKLRTSEAFLNTIWSISISFISHTHTHTLIRPCEVASNKRNKSPK